jgi:hypothetical protein
MNGDNLSNMRCEASRIFRNRRGGYLRDKINDSEYVRHLCRNKIEIYDDGVCYEM